MAYINKINKPTKIIMDLDSVLFAAASAAQQVKYTYKDKQDNIVAVFDSAKSGKNWVEGITDFGIDIEHGYTGPVEELSRDVSYEVGDVRNAYKMFDRLLEGYLKQVGNLRWKGKVAAKTGAKNHRLSKCSIQEYKGNRKGATKPYYTEDVRRHALTYKEVSKSIGGLESDDYIVSMAQERGQDCLAWMPEKDVFVTSGAWFFAPNLMDEPLFSPPDIIGKLWIDGRGKLVGCGFLFCIAQALMGDQADYYAGCKGCGEKMTFEILGEHSGKSWDKLPEVIHAALQPFRKVYGESYKYNHCMTGKPMDVTFREVFIENLTLAYMVKSVDDRPWDSIKIARGFK